MTQGARLGGAGPRARLPECVGDGTAVAGRDTARTRPKAGPVRTCVGCRERGPRSALVRVVRVDGDGQPRAEVDPGRSRPGRGAWLHAELQCLERAERRQALPRALRTPTLDVSQVRRAFGVGLVQLGSSASSAVQDVADGDVHVRFTDMGSGLEADGPPMSTRR